MSAMVFFWVRVAHAVIFWLGIPSLRTLDFAAGLVGTLGIFWEIAAGAPAGGDRRLEGRCRTDKNDATT